MPGARDIIWEHGRCNVSMRAAGLMSLIFPIADGGEVCGIGIFNADPEVISGGGSYAAAPKAKLLSLLVQWYVLLQTA
jgi:hypothetical protein